jgi:hypothetical protein
MNRFLAFFRHQKPTVPSAATMVVSNEKKTGFVPPPEEVARKAYFNYVNHGSVPGHETQHWLAAEAELILEHDRPESHHFPHQT